MLLKAIERPVLVLVLVSVLATKAYVSRQQLLNASFSIEKRRCTNRSTDLDSSLTPSQLDRPGPYVLSLVFSSYFQLKPSPLPLLSRFLGLSGSFGYFWGILRSVHGHHRGVMAWVFVLRCCSSLRHVLVLNVSGCFCFGALSFPFVHCFS